jgi:hypothetical protein
LNATSARPIGRALLFRSFAGIFHHHFLFHFMHHLYKFVCVVFSAMVLLSGCKGKDGDPGPAGATGATGATGPAGQTPTGNLVGFVSPLDENGINLPKAGVTVTITNTTPALTQTTDANGRYEFVALRSGTYNLTFTRNDLSLFKVFGYGHVGGDQPGLLGTTYLTAYATTVVSNVTVGSAQYSPNVGFYTPLNLVISGGGNINSSYRRVALYASASPGVNSTTGTLINSYYLYSNGTTAQLQVLRAELNAAGFASGTAVYVVLYGAPYYNGLSYTDIATGRSILSGLNPTASQVVSFIVP